MSDQISWHVELQLKPGQLHAFRVLTSEMVESTKSEVGALIYERFIAGDSQVVHVVERYADSSSAVAHLTAFGKKYGARFEKLVDRKRFAVFGTPSLELKQTLDPLGAKYASPFAGFSRI